MLKLEADMAFPDLDEHIVIRQYQVASVELTHRKKNSHDESSL